MPIVLVTGASCSQNMLFLVLKRGKPDKVRDLTTGKSGNCQGENLIGKNDLLLTCYF